MNELKVFISSDYGVIRTAGTSEEPLFCLADVCKALDLDPSQVTKRLDDGVVTIHPTQDALGRMREANFVNEDGLYDVILDSRKPQAKAFRKWITHDIMPSIRKTGSYTAPAAPTLSEEMKVAQWAMKQLRLSDVARLHMVKQITDKVGLTLPGQMANGYVPSKGDKFSATELLKRNGINLSALAFNKIAAAKGALEQLTRPGKSGKVHKWWSITKQFLSYGENDVNEKNPLETTAHWYSDKFASLCDKLNIKREEVAV